MKFSFTFRKGRQFYYFRHIHYVERLGRVQVSYWLYLPFMLLVAVK